MTGPTRTTPPPATTARTGWLLLAAASIATLVAALWGVPGAYASWSHAEDVSAGTVSTGHVGLDGDGDLTFEVNGEEFDPTTGDLCTGDTVRITVPVSIAATGTNMAPVLTRTATPDLPAQVTVTDVNLDAINQALTVSPDPQTHLVQIDVTSPVAGRVTLSEELTLTAAPGSTWTSTHLLETPPLVFEGCRGQLVTTWDTALATGSGPQASIYVSGASGSVDWGDGTPAEPISGAATMTHTFTTPGVYTATLTGTFHAVRFPSPALVSVDRWDEGTETTSIANAFVSAHHLRSAVSPPSTVTTMASAFMASSANPQLLDWDTTNVTTMSSMFDGASSFDGDLSTWDTSNVTNMSYMFNGASAFTGDLRTWNVALIPQEPAGFRAGANALMQSPLWGTTGLGRAEVDADPEAGDVLDVEEHPAPGEDSSEPAPTLPDVPQTPQTQVVPESQLAGERPTDEISVDDRGDGHEG